MQQFGSTVCRTGGIAPAVDGVVVTQSTDSPRAIPPAHFVRQRHQAASGRGPIAKCATGNRGAFHAPGFSIVPKQSPDAIARIVDELMDRSLTKAERIQRLRELAKSGDDVPDELMDQALRKLMERITE
jgi:hypothetical protein